MFYVVMPARPASQVRRVFVAVIVCLCAGGLVPAVASASPPRISAPANGALLNTAKTKVSFTIDPGSSARCSTDGGIQLLCTSPYATPPLLDGTHQVAIEAKDNTGNVETSIVTFQTDTTRPVVSLAGSPDEGAFTSSLQATLGASANEPASFECALDSWSFASCVPSVDITFDAPADGVHRFAVRAVDSAGNYSLAASRSWTVDTIAPAPPTILSPTGLAAVPSATPTVSGNAEPFSTIELTVDGLTDGTAVAGPNGSWSATTTTHLNDAMHSFSAVAIDRAGNTSTASPSLLARVDAADPIATIESRPAATVNRSSATFNFSADEESSFECSVDGSSFAPCAAPLLVAGLSDGAHSFSLIATDLGGHDSAVVTHVWTIDTTPPQITLEQTTPAPLASPVFTFSANEPIGSYRCRLDGQGSFTVCASPFAAPPLAVGAHRFELRAVDLMGNLASRIADFVVSPLEPPAPVVVPPSTVPPPTTPAKPLSSTTCNALGDEPGIPAAVSITAVRAGTKGVRFTLTLDRDALIQLAVTRNSKAVSTSIAPVRGGKRSINVRVRASRLRTGKLAFALTALSVSGGRSVIAAPLRRDGTGKLVADAPAASLHSALECVRPRRARTARVSIRLPRATRSAADRIKLQARARQWSLVGFRLVQGDTRARRVVLLRPNRWIRVTLRALPGKSLGTGGAFVQTSEATIDGRWRTRNRRFSLD